MLPCESRALFLQFKWTLLNSNSKNEANKFYESVRNQQNFKLIKLWSISQNRFRFIEEGGLETYYPLQDGNFATPRNTVQELSTAQQRKKVWDSHIVTWQERPSIITAARTIPQRELLVMCWSVLLTVETTVTGSIPGNAKTRWWTAMSKVIK